MSWASFIADAPTGDHGVQVYDAPSELGDAVARFLDAGFRRGDPALVVATADHWLHVARDLEAREWDPEVLERQGLLTYRDADATLDAFMDGDLPSAQRFEAVVGGLVDSAATRFPGHTMRVFGEMVDLLWARGHERGAVVLEELWNDLQRTRRFSLLCAYHLDIFDVDVQTEALPAVFGTHTHARPAADSPRLTAALDQALAEVVGPIGAARIYLDVAEDVPRGALPRAQAILAWLAANKPAVAASILDRARSHYRSMRPAPSAV
jgi:MEDS: MEthanogen/methylotroph, DcmR Sensory domain